jgi:hypothetical protein
LPITDAVVRSHLLGRDDHGADFVMGVYPLLLDESCFFLAMDFDKRSWQEDAPAVLATCERVGVPAVLERSRSGNGGHVWIFFDGPVPASLARRLGAHILTETMEHRPEIGLASYDRLFPNQDTLPQGGFGNLIALPLQGESRRRGNSVFVNATWKPYADQWEYLCRVPRMSATTVERIVRDASQRGRIIGVRLVCDEDSDIEPWKVSPPRTGKPTITGPLPERVELTLGDQIYIPKEALPAALRNQLIRLAAFQNPEFYKAQSMRLSTTTSHASLPVPRNWTDTSDCHADASRRSTHYSPICKSASKCVMNGSLVHRSVWRFRDNYDQSNLPPLAACSRMTRAC